MQEERSFAKGKVQGNNGKKVSCQRENLRKRSAVKEESKVSYRATSLNGRSERSLVQEKRSVVKGKRSR